MTQICLTNFEHRSNGVGAGNMGFTGLLPGIDCSFEGGHCARLAGQPVDSLTRLTSPLLYPTNIYLTGAVQ